MSHTTVNAVFVPVRIESAANAWDSFWVRAKKNKRLRSTAFAYLTVARFPKDLPATIIMTRVAPRDLDDDNLSGAFKSVRDGIADYFGPDDRDKRYTWRVAQRRAVDGEEKYGAMITIEREVGV